MIKKIKQENRSDFTVVGYSFGSLVAIELVRKLEAEGMVGKLIVIDGSPDLMKEIKKQHLKSKSDEELQNNILLGMMDTLHPAISSQVSVSLFFNYIYLKTFWFSTILYNEHNDKWIFECTKIFILVLKLVAELEKFTTWDERLQAFLTCVSKVSDFKVSMKSQAAFCTAIYKRLQAVENHDVSKVSPIKTSMILIKPTQPTVRTVPEDYGLGKVCRYLKIIN